MTHTKSNFIINLIISAVLCAGEVFSPYATLPIIIVSIVFFTVFAYRNELKRNIIILSVALITLLASYFSYGINIDTVCAALSDFCLIALSGSAIGIMMKHRCSYRTVISGGALAFLSPLLIEFAKLRFYYGYDLIQVFITEPLDAMLAMYSDIIATSGTAELEPLITELTNSKWALVQVIASITPAMLILVCSLCSFITFLVFRKIIFCKYGEVMTEYPHFWELQLPRSASWILSLLYISTFFVIAPTITNIVLNVIIILCALYFICGISTIDFFLNKKRIHWILRIIIYAIALVLLLIFGAAYFGVILIGVLDGAFDFRHIRARRSEQ